MRLHQEMDSDYCHACEYNTGGHTCDLNKPPGDDGFGCRCLTVSYEPDEECCHLCGRYIEEIT